MRFWLLFVVALLIVYGSLYPFQFTVPPSAAGAWEKLLFDWTAFTSKGDALGNLVLFLPFGAAGALAFEGRLRALAAAAAILAAGFVLATALQVAQIYFPPRTPAMADVVWNMAGTVLGILAAALLKGRYRPALPGWRDEYAVPLALLGLWIAAELVPFVPSLDMQALRNSAKTLLRLELSAPEVAWHAAGVLLAGRVLKAVAGAERAAHWLALLVAAVAGGKVLVVTRVLDCSTLAGLAAGYGLWRYLWGAPHRWRGETFIPVALLGAYTLKALVPFEARAVPADFNWIPFARMLEGSMLLNSVALAESVFAFAGVLGIVQMQRMSVGASSVALALWVAGLEAIQMYLVGRTPDVTEPLLVLLVGQLLRAAPVPAATRPAASRPPAPAARPAAAPPRDAAAPRRGFDRRRAAALAIICFAIACAIAVVLRLPRIPYNVIELFHGNGAFPFLLIFALAVLWTGAGARLAGRYAAASPRPWLALPLLAFGAGLVSVLLLSASVTQESLADIAGSNNLYWYVINKNIWGDWARRLFALIGSEGLVSFFERPVRYAALYGPLVTFAAFMYAAIELRERKRLRPLVIVPLLVSSGLWLWLCKGIAFDWSSTDNLNELIARDGPWGWGGGGYLYALTALICANAVLLSRTPLAPGPGAVAAFVTIAAVPLGWWLLNEGLDQQVHKYELVFSGVQFLLGPDRKNLLGPEVLALRWAVVQLAGVLMMAAGARFAEPLADPARQKTDRNGK